MNFKVDKKPLTSEDKPAPFDLIKKYFYGKAEVEPETDNNNKIDEADNVPAKKSRSTAKTSSPLKKTVKGQAKFDQIKQYIYQQIKSGKWPKETKVPSENKLASQFSVSRMTARRSLQELTDEGLLVRIQGSGTFVSTLPSKQNSFHIPDIKDDIVARGHQHHNKQLRLKATAVTHELSTLLSLKGDEHIYYSEVLHSEDGEPIQFEQRYVNADLLPDYLMQSFNTTTPQEYISSILPCANECYEIKAIIADEAIQEKLAITTNIACLEVIKKMYTEDGTVCVAIITSRGDKYQVS